MRKRALSRLPALPKALSEGEECLDLHLRAKGILYEREFLFAAPDRKYRADFHIIGHRLLIEVDGGTWISGRHNRGSSIARDFEKGNLAVLLGYRVLKYTTEQVIAGEAIRDILSILTPHR